MTQSHYYTLAGIRLALLSCTKKIGFPGWPEPILDSVYGFGASIVKGGLAPAPFSIFCFRFPCFSFLEFSRKTWPKKMSGRWGERPLGRGGWRILQSEASFLLPNVPLRSRAAERHIGANKLRPFSYSGSRNQLPTTGASLRSVPVGVDSPPDTFRAVLHVPPKNP